MELNLKVNNVGVINTANININKINVVGGVNSSGKTTVSKLLYCYLKSPEAPQKLIENEGYLNINTENIKFSSNTKFKDIFYLESISVLDLKDLEILNLDHIKHIKECLEIKNQNSKPDITSKIQNIINDDCYSSAGIKQIGVIQILLENNSLKEDSFLFIDEPESNLHPDWQIKFAEILVLLTKELNITLYLNSYSPIFIEAISLYSQYNDLLNDTNFYLTKKQTNGKFNFKKINPKNMGEVYENLTKSYDELDKLKAKILFKE
ncbi:MAG: ATP-binding protein [Methanobrevibacter sp.]|nr:ATP-binding protein [Methanobrevibacter sp.]